MSVQQIVTIIASELQLRVGSVDRTISLLDDGNTIPFIARYRKEVTSGLDEDQLRKIESRLNYLRNLYARKEVVLRSIEEQGNLTPELERQIREAVILGEVEDLYRPYRPKRRTRATVARENGLEPLADLILEQPAEKLTLEELAGPFLSDEVATVEDAWAGARDIVAETIAEDATVRQSVRSLFGQRGELLADVTDEAKDPVGKYRDYYHFDEKLQAIPPHRLMALRRGEKEGILKTGVIIEEDDALDVIMSRYVESSGSPFAAQLTVARRDAYTRLLKPTVARESLRLREESADEHATSLFAANLRQLLLQPPLKGRRVIGIDPGYRTGCKVALVDETGRYLAGATIYPHEPAKRKSEARQTLAQLVRQHRIDVVAIGNGTASRETEALVAEMIEEGDDLAYVMVSEAGASVYSASPLARDELPDLDVSMRGAVSIARRLQDPLAELVKIEPRSIGVGLYQHDVDQKRLNEALDIVVESAVNHVGVDINTASISLLQHVAGLNKRAASLVVAHRDKHGPFHSREEVRGVKGVGPKAFAQAAGFLRISGGNNSLDNTPIHPESYAVCQSLLDLENLTVDSPNLPARMAALAKTGNLSELAQQLGVGEPTLRDIVESLAHPGRDPREDLPKPILRKDVLKLEDLTVDMILQGTVRNIVDFGAFVDIGVKRDGLVHISEMADHYVRSPLDVVKVGDIVAVQIISVDQDRGRISLSMRT